MEELDEVEMPVALENVEDALVVRDGGGKVLKAGLRGEEHISI